MNVKVDLSYRRVSDVIKELQKIKSDMIKKGCKSDEIYLEVEMESVPYTDGEERIVSRVYGKESK